MMDPVKVAIIGTGAISEIYLQNILYAFREIELRGFYDLVQERAEKAAEYVRNAIRKGVKTPEPMIYKDMYEAFDDPEVDVILNLTRPCDHFDVSKKALEHGKHVYSEKPLGVNMDEVNTLIALAESKGLKLGGAPDTFMGAGIQTCRKLIDDGMIGDVIGGSCAMVCHGHETWHPDPTFYYKKGGGPMLDMGPYYITALVNLVGEAKGVMGMAKKSFAKRVITSAPHYGEVIDVDVDTYLSGNIEFSNGAIVQMFTTFDVYYTGQARFELYGTKGTMMVPDPNCFGGPVLVYRPEDQAAASVTDPALEKKNWPNYCNGFREVPLMFDYSENSRALGLADMCRAIHTGRGWRADYRLQRHVMEIMAAFSESCEKGTYIPVTSGFQRGEPMKNNPIHGILD